MNVKGLEAQQTRKLPEPPDVWEVLARRRLELLAARRKLAGGEAIAEHIGKMNNFPVMVEKIKNKEIDPQEIAEVLIREEVRLAEVHYESAKRKAGL